MITRLDTTELQAALKDLADVLRRCVEAGASVGFVLPFSEAEACAYWRDRIFPAVQSGQTDLFAARAGERIVGTVQLAAVAMPNQPHRADVAKLLVHPDARRRGLGRMLMAALEERAKARGMTLLVLDTRSFDPSLQLYRSIGFEIAGEIPGYCLDPQQSRFDPTTYMFKSLG